MFAEVRHMCMGDSMYVGVFVGLHVSGWLGLYENFCSLCIYIYFFLRIFVFPRIPFVACRNSMFSKCFFSLSPDYFRCKYVG